MTATHSAAADVEALPAICGGRSFPLGASVADGGVNFSVFSKEAERIELLLFDGVNAKRPSRVIALDSSSHRTWQYW
ncbi:MAG: hypothetical protein ACRETL_12795, partial [Gammaproteobacteria bacterium]